MGVPIPGCNNFIELTSLRPEESCAGLGFLLLQRGLMVPVKRCNNLHGFRDGQSQTTSGMLNGPDETSTTDELFKFYQQRGRDIVRLEHH